MMAAVTAARPLANQGPAVAAECSTRPWADLSI